MAQATKILMKIFIKFLDIDEISHFFLQWVTNDLNCHCRTKTWVSCSWWTKLAENWKAMETTSTFC